MFFFLAFHCFWNVLGKMPGVVSQLPGGKSIKHGVETVTELMWIGWEPGKEYTKHIVLKNVRVKTQKVKYKCVLYSLVLFFCSFSIIAGIKKLIIYRVLYLYTHSLTHCCA